MHEQYELESGEKRPRTIIDSHEARKETPIWCFASFGQSWIDSNCESLVEGSILAGDCGWGRRGGRRHPRDRDHQDITLLVTPTLPITKEPGNPLPRCQLFRATKILDLIRHLPSDRTRYRPRQDCFETFLGKGGEPRIATLIQEDHLYRSL
jgi:hypothetical protein